jgi:glycosyltransferase involved in cell wall biosynthesis
MIRIAIVTTHPIQYNAPLFKFLSKKREFLIRIFYTWGENSNNIYDPGFDTIRSWDIDLFDGYDYAFVKNIAQNPGTHHFCGIVNPDLNNLVEIYNPDILIIYGWKFHSHLNVIRFFSGKLPIILRGDSTLLDDRIGLNIKKIFRKILLRWVYKHINYAFSPGSASNKYFEWVGLRSNQIINAKHAVDNMRFMGNISNAVCELHRQAIDWKKKLGIAKEKKIFLFAGKFESKKDPIILIKAFKNLLLKRSDIHLIMVGSGVLEKEILSIVSGEITKGTIPSISNHFTLLPFQNQSLMPVVYRLADVFTMTSKGPGETWGLAVNEAMLSGKAVIVSDKCGCAADLLVGENEKYIFKAGNINSLVKTMELILEDNNYLKAGVINKKIIQTFNYNSFYEALKFIDIKPRS